MGVRAVYLGRRIFDYETALEAAPQYDASVEDSSVDKGNGEGATSESTHNRLKKETKKWLVHDGEAWWVECMWFTNGVAHRFTATADWFSAFVDATEVFEEQTEKADSDIREPEHYELAK
jgi:hypothetical protein